MHALFLKKGGEKPGKSEILLAKSHDSLYTTTFPAWLSTRSRLTSNSDLREETPPRIIIRPPRILVRGSAGEDIDNIIYGEDKVWSCVKNILATVHLAFQRPPCSTYMMHVWSFYDYVMHTSLPS